VNRSLFALLAASLLAACSSRGVYQGIQFLGPDGPTSAVACALFLVDSGNLYEPGQTERMVGYRVASDGTIGPETTCVGGGHQTYSPIPLDGGGALRFTDAVIAREDATGQALWSTTLPFAPLSAALTTEGHLYVSRGRDLGHLLVSDGVVSWTRTLNP